MFEAIQVAVLSGLNDGSTGSTNAVGAKAVLKQHALFRQFVDVWRWIDLFVDAVVCTNCVGSVVIGKDENDVGSFVFRSIIGRQDRFGRNQQAKSNASQKEYSIHKMNNHSLI